MQHRVAPLESKRADTGAFDGALDEKRTMYYDSNWRLLEQQIDDDFVTNAGINRHVQHFSGARYIDDATIMRSDNDADGDYFQTNQTENHATPLPFTRSSTPILLPLTPTLTLLPRTIIITLAPHWNGNALSVAFTSPSR